MNVNFNCTDGCNLPSEPNDIKILLKEIKADVEKLIKDTEAKLLLHDGKIAELCLYLKNNLSNSIRCLLLDMQNSGELDEIIKDVVQESYIELITKVEKFENTYSYSTSLYNDLVNENGGVL